MTEDMRERCPSCQADDDVRPYIDGRGMKMFACGRCVIQWQAALSSAGTSGTAAAEKLAKAREKAVEVAKNLLWDSVVLQPAIEDFDETVASIADYIQSGFAFLLRGDSLSGKGEATRCKFCGDTAILDRYGYCERCNRGMERTNGD